MKYKNAVSYLESFQRLGIHLGLERVNKLLSLLGDPQNDFDSIHVAGTNGKGSVCAMMSSILSAAGYNVGLYTSPHLIDYTERIRICEKDISRARFASAVNDVKRQLERSDISGLTEFELLTAAAFHIFSREKVDIVIVETGLGGRLDATNVIEPLLSIITNVEMEHSQILGSTIAKISHEKAGIIKERIPVITQETKKQALEVLKKIAKEKDSQLTAINSDRSMRISGFHDMGNNGSEFMLSGTREKIKFSLNGQGQVGNIRTALLALRKIADKYPVDKKALSQGLSKVRWPARLQYLSKNVLLDGAHNPSGARFLCQYLRSVGKKVTFVVGMQKDKDHKNYIKTLLPIAKAFVITKAANDRAQEPRKIARFISKKNIPVIIKDRPKTALRYANKERGNSLVCVTGSLYLAGEILATFPAISSKKR